MPSTAVFVRKATKPLLRRYFASKDIVLPEWLTWNEPTTTPVLRAIEELDRDVHERVTSDFGRVTALSDDAGQNAIYAVIQKSSDIDALPNGHARALWVYLDAPEIFRRAEEIRYTDDRRHGKQWDGFVGSSHIALKRDDATVEDFKELVRQRFQSPNVHVDVFDRVRRRHARGDLELVQATVYLEGKQDQALEFVDGNLDVRDHRPVIEASLTYEPATGSIEVVAGDRQTREDFVRLFAQGLLGCQFKGERLPVRYFEIDKLRRPFGFPTDASDKIERVRINSMRLAPRDTASQRISWYAYVRLILFHDRVIANS